MKKMSVTSFLLCMFMAGSATAVPFPGPDAFGYTGSATPFNLRDVSGTGNDIGLDDADDEVSVVSIGFDFDFYGATYSEVEISSNGFMSFTQTGNSACCSGETIATPGGEIDNFIAGYWEDLAPSEGGIIRTQAIGAVGAREFIVGFYEVRDVDDPVNSINTFEMILHEITNDIELQLAQIQFEDVDDKVIGIENIDGTDGLELAFFEYSDPFSNGDILFANEGYCISAGGTNCSVVTSVPEPTSLALFAISLAGFGFSRRKRDA